MGRERRKASTRGSEGLRGEARRGGAGSQMRTLLTLAKRRLKNSDDISAGNLAGVVRAVLISDRPLRGGRGEGENGPHVALELGREELDERRVAFGLEVGLVRGRTVRVERQLEVEGCVQPAQSTR